MFGRKTVMSMVDQSAENPSERRKFLRSAGLAGLGTVGAVAMLRSGSEVAEAAPNDGTVLNFALNLEYLEAQFYSHAVHGHGIDSSLTDGKGDHGKVIGGHQVPFQTKRIRQYAEEIAGDELHHVKFLRKALGGAKVAQPTLDLKSSFTAAAQAAGVIKKGQSFDPFANEDNFLLGAYIFEDVGVTAYKGAAPLISNKTYLSAAAGILAVEAYHAATIRTSLYERELYMPARKISAARDSLDGKTDDDKGIHWSGGSNITPTTGHAIAYGRTPGAVLNVVYLNPGKASKGGFFPHGVNGDVNTSASH
ncbi:hypothetical protein GCM10011575_42730 [Microlunatus endophyticus]|uniref:Ferritin-like domain-containing protein n=2 Tax=Microlunatus endophyticus TaxID=1716077 RepID=A0A917W964_9ACTN|nr:hypothetical protein GCM10011575_42730 [Microlunatus endophyticus]